MLVCVGGGPGVCVSVRSIVVAHYAHIRLDSTTIRLLFFFLLSMCIYNMHTLDAYIIFYALITEWFEISQ